MMNKKMVLLIVLLMEIVLVITLTNGNLLPEWLDSVYLAWGFIIFNIFVLSAIAFNVR